MGLARGGFLSAMTLAVTAATYAGVLETSDELASIVVSPVNAPAPLELCCHSQDFSVLMWLRRSVNGEATFDEVLTGGDVLQIGFDDVEGDVRFRLAGEPMDLTARVPFPGFGEWMLLACTWEADASRLTAWVGSERAPLASDEVEAADWTGGPAWPITIGRAGLGGSSFAGQLGLTVVRDHRIDAGDVDAVWNDGAPHYFAPALLDTGNMTSMAGVIWMIGHGVVTNPARDVNPSGSGAELGDVVTLNNLLVYAPPGGYTSAGLVTGVTGAWVQRSPHETGEAWSGFFVRELPDEFETPHVVPRVSPLAKRLADDEPVGLIRVIASANSHVGRDAFSYGSLENFSPGGLFHARKASMAGVIVPAFRKTTTQWPGFIGTGRRDGVVHDTFTTPLNSVSFGNFGSHGTDLNFLFPDYPLVGTVIVVEDGSAYVPKARPEPGTLFDDATDALTVRALLLKHPGSGDVVYRGEKAIDQHGEAFTAAGDPQTLALDTSVFSYALTEDDIVLESALHLPAGFAGIEVGQGCSVVSGPGLHGITIVTQIAELPSVTVVVFEKPLPTLPEPGRSVLEFGPVEPVWVEHRWGPLEADDPEIYRGIRLSASGGHVVVLFQECFNPGVDGFIAGGVGKNGHGYATQLERMFSETGVPLMEALEADVWLQFPADQHSSPSSMDAYTETIRANSPQAEIWWCGDPDYDLDLESTILEGWQTYILENAEANDVGAIVAQEHPSVGTGNERTADGQAADTGHLTGRGNVIFVTALLEMMQEAALPAPCAADIDGDGAVGTGDLVQVIINWGAADPSIDIAPPGGDGVVDVLDLILLLDAWGPCP